MYACASLYVIVHALPCERVAVCMSGELHDLCMLSMVPNLVCAWVCLCMVVQACIRLCIVVQACIRLCMVCKLAYACAWMCKLVCACACLCKLLFGCASLHTLVHGCASLCIVEQACIRFHGVQACTRLYYHGSGVTTPFWVPFGFWSFSFGLNDYVSQCLSVF